MVNVNEQTVLHKLSIDGGAFAQTQEPVSGAFGSTADHQPVPKDDPTLITFILQQLSSNTQLESLCALNSTADIFGRRPLHYAAMHGYPNITRALLKDLKTSGEFIDFSNPYWFDTDGFTPLIYAVSRGHHAVMKVLIEEGDIKDVDAIANGKSITFRLSGETMLTLLCSNLTPCISFFSISVCDDIFNPKDHAFDTHDSLKPTGWIRYQSPRCVHLHSFVDCLPLGTC